jgi:hypothetical protein
MNRFLYVLEKPRQIPVEYNERSKHQLIDGHTRRMNLIDAEFADVEQLRGEIPGERKRTAAEADAVCPIPRMRRSTFTLVRRRICAETAVVEGDGEEGADDEVSNAGAGVEGG